MFFLALYLVISGPGRGWISPLKIMLRSEELKLAGLLVEYGTLAYKAHGILHYKEGSSIWNIKSETTKASRKINIRTGRKSSIYSTIFEISHLK